MKTTLTFLCVALLAFPFAVVFYALTEKEDA
jgi:hypothetical protein